MKRLTCIEMESNHLLQNIHMHNRDLSLCPHLQLLAGTQAYLGIFGELIGQAPKEVHLHWVEEAFGKDFMLWPYIWQTDKVAGS